MVPGRSRPSTRLPLTSPCRGVASANVVIPLVAALLVSIVVFSPAERGTRIDVRATERFLDQGPMRGLWRQESLHGAWDVIVVPHPDEAACVLAARLGEDGRIAPCGLKPLPRGRFARHFVPGPPDLFFRNYRRAEATQEIIDGRPVIRATWVPMHDPGGETARIFWVDPRREQVVRFEDRSIDDGLIRALYLRSPRVEELGVDLRGPARSDDEMRRCLGLVKADEERGAPDLAALAAQLPFPLLYPLRPPPGFQLRAARLVGRPDDRAGPLAVLDYRDGMALVRLLQGTREAIDLFEERERARDRRHREEGACPSLPDEATPITSGGLRILRRKDRCRTVLRVDGIEGVSVTVIGCNELSQDAYLEVVESLDVVDRVP